MSNTVSVCSCLDGLINDKPFMPWGTPTQQAAALMELAEQDGKRLGPQERHLILNYAEAVRDGRSIMDLVFELAGNAYELQCGSVDAVMEDYILREIAAAYAAEDEKVEALAAAM